MISFVLWWQRVMWSARADSGQATAITDNRMLYYITLNYTENTTRIKRTQAQYWYHKNKSTTIRTRRASNFYLTTEIKSQVSYFCIPSRFLSHKIQDCTLHTWIHRCMTRVKTHSWLMRYSNSDRCEQLCLNHYYANSKPFVLTLLYFYHTRSHSRRRQQQRECYRSLAHSRRDWLESVR